MRSEKPYERAKFTRRCVVDVAGLPVAVTSSEDLIRFKLAWARGIESTRQAEDVQLLLRNVPGLDDAHLQQWTDALEVTVALEALRPDA